MRSQLRGHTYSIGYRFWNVIGHTLSISQDIVYFVLFDCLSFTRFFFNHNKLRNDGLKLIFDFVANHRM